MIMILILLFVHSILILKVVVIGGGILILLIFGDQIIHIRLCLGKLHFVHSLAGIPMQERLPPEHGRKLLSHPFEHILDRRRIPDEGRRHFQSLWGNITN